MSERPRDNLWDCLDALFGAVRTESERGRRNKAVKELRDAGATVEEVEMTYRYCHRTYSVFHEMSICTNLSNATSRQLSAWKDPSSVMGCCGQTSGEGHLESCARLRIVS